MGTFADGLMSREQKGIKGPKVRLTKLRGRMLLDMIERLEEDTTLMNPDMQDDYCATLQWLTNEIHKRWSIADLYRI